MRSSVDPRAVTTAARNVLHDLVARRAAALPRRSREIYAASLGARHFNLTLVAVFAATALLLAVAGIYGVMAYNVTRRRREIGVRIALGATPHQVVSVILSQGLRTIAVGIVAGVVGAWLLTRLARSRCSSTSRRPIRCRSGPSSLLLAAVAALACYLPARRGTRVNPVEALRQE